MPCPAHWMQGAEHMSCAAAPALQLPGDVDEVAQAQAAALSQAAPTLQAQGEALGMQQPSEHIPVVLAARHHVVPHQYPFQKDDVAGLAASHPLLCSLAEVPGGVPIQEPLHGVAAGVRSQEPLQAVQHHGRERELVLGSPRR
eukprot:CAMPEP_0168411374 /NCGR_PEP_ID=MMETSP0228-20121227/28168_1 /TAXON_ID=133427 /ORGANISM="Protoceratium reticulatum, Strain CCCM 535 (=CCMP 1889)" /LENGTH=142 /DNA_ID=CAMNT_0008425119 /DNA_START=109 /DNA_END=536 /DNA_ORIENTATION=-